MQSTAIFVDFPQICRDIMAKIPPVNMRLVLVPLVIGLLYAADADQEAISAHLQRAREAQQHGNFVAAAAEWQAVVALSPQTAEAHSNLGMMWHFAGQYQKAIPAFQQASKLDPGLLAPHLFTGIDYYLTSHPRAAVPELRRALALDPGNRLAAKWLGMSYFQIGDFSQSVVVLEAAARTDPTDLDLLFFESRVCSRILFQSYETVKSLAPDSPYLRALRSEPKRSQTNLSPGSDPEMIRLSALLKEGKPEEALAPLLAYTRSKPEAVEAWYLLGKASEALALKSLDRFLSLSPNSYRTHQLQAEYDRAAGDDVKAAAEYRKALVMNAAAVQIHLELGNIFMAHHDSAHAVPEYEAELSVDPYSLAALQRIGQAYADLHEPELARKYLARALKIEPLDYEASRVLGKVQYELGNYADALQHYLTAFKNRTGSDSSLPFQISKVYRSLGNDEQANVWLNRFRRELSDEHQKVRRELSSKPEP